MLFAFGFLIKFWNLTPQAKGILQNREMLWWGKGKISLL